MPRRLSTTIQHIDQINHPCKGESSLLFRPSGDTVGRRKSRPTKKQCARWSDALLPIGRGKRIWPSQTRPAWSVDPRARLPLLVERPGTHTKEFDRRGSHHARPSRQNNLIECGYSGKFNHYEEEFRKKKRDSGSTNRQLTNYATYFDYDDHGEMFVMRHKTHSNVGIKCIQHLHFRQCMVC